MWKGEDESVYRCFFVVERVWEMPRRLSAMVFWIGKQPSGLSIVSPSVWRTGIGGLSITSGKGVQATTLTLNGISYGKVARVPQFLRDLVFCTYIRADEHHLCHIDLRSNSQCSLFNACAPSARNSSNPFILLL